MVNISMINNVLLGLIITTTISVGLALYCNHKKVRVGLLILAIVKSVLLLIINTVTIKDVFIKERFLPVLITAITLILIYLALDYLEQKAEKED